MTNGYAKWKIMVYISADGLLANFAVESLKQLKRAGGNGVVVVAESSGTEGLDGAGDALAQGVQCAGAVPLGGLGPLLEPAVLGLVGFDA